MLPIGAEIKTMPFASASSTHESCTAYPNYVDRRECGISTGSQLLNGWLCDPENTVSMSELYVIDDTLQRIYSQYGETCLCRPDSGVSYWH